MSPHCVAYFLLIFLGLNLVFFPACSQRGKIIRPASAAVLDPNADGFTSKTTAGFSNDGYYVDEFELNMFGVPKLDGDVAGDNIGANCGITDLIPDNKGFAVYAVRDGSDNLIFRFRVGDDNPSVEAWTILLDTDGKMGPDDPNPTGDNPGFEIDITLIKRNNSGVLVYDIDGRDDCPAPELFYGIDSHFQISIADEVSCGDPDYFYDFYVPFGEIASRFGIDLNTGLRYVAVTNVSATCAMGGNISDISGVDNNDPEYSGCNTCAFEDLVNNQCPTPIVDLCEACAGFEKDKVSAPIIDEPIRAGQTLVTGGTIESDIFIRLQVYTNTAPDGSTPAWGVVPREEQGVYAAGNSWSVLLASPLLAYDKIVAIAQKDEFTVPCGANDDNSSSTSVTVVAPNTAPVAANQAVTVTEDTPRAIILGGSDPENDPLTYTLTAPPANGMLSGTPPNVTYTPAGDYSGADSFTFAVHDGIFTSVAPGTVMITVTPVNDAPVANSLQVATDEDTPAATTLTASDIDGDPLIFTIVTPPAHGTLSGVIPNLTYTPAPDYFGQDNFTFRVNDGQEDSNTATVSVTITAVANDAPLADAQTVSTAEDTPLPVTLSGSDPDADPLTFEIVSAPANGTLTGTAPDVTYSPAAHYAGSDSFTFRVNDGSLNSPAATIDITVTPENDVPVAFDQSVPYDLNTPKAITLSGSDPDGDALTFSVTDQPANGALSGTPPDVTYTPAMGFTGSDSFTFIVNDGSTDSGEATISLSLAPVSNVAPVAADKNLTTKEDAPAQVMLTATDANGDMLTFAITQQPANGTLAVAGANITYTPDPDYNGADVFRFEASDGSLTSNEAAVAITVTPLNDAPIANSQSVTTEQNNPVMITLTGSDVEGSPLTYIVLTQPAHGALVASGASVTFTPAPQYTGADNFTFRVHDGELNSSTATVSLLINPDGAPPVAMNKNVSTDEDTPVDVDLATLVTDPDGDPMTYNVMVAPQHGALQVNGSVVTYTPAPGYHGTDKYTFSGNDGKTDSNTGTVFITVVEVTGPPVSHDQDINTDEDVAADILLSASDPDGDALLYTVVTLPAHGILSGTVPSLTYTPADDYHGADSFTFRTSDGTTSSNVAMVSITVDPVNDAPVITPLTALPPTKEDSVLRICLNVVDIDGDPVNFDTPLNVKGGGTMTRNAVPFDFCYTFTPAANYNGESRWNAFVSDPEGASGTTPAGIIIQPVNDTPVALNEFASVPANGALSFNVVANDLPIAAPYKEFYDIYEADSADALSITGIISGPFHGSVSLVSDGLTLGYTPSSLTFIGSDSVKYQVCDTGTPSLCATAVLFIDVTDNDFAFKVYEGVSPNNDGLNDYLHIEGIHRHPKNVVRIFDRFNNMVWENPDYDNEAIRWEGQSNRGLGRARLPEGTYYYTVHLADNGKLYSGYVLLKEQ